MAGHSTEPGGRIGVSDRRSSWRLNMLGSWQLSRDGGAVDVGSNAQRLFAVVALSGRCERSYLSGLLWPRCTEPHARANLRATLSRLHRRRCREPLEAVNGTVDLRAEVEVDVRTLVVAASAVLSTHPPSPDRTAIEHLYGADLLLGWYDDWVLVERERLRRLRLHALEALSAQFLAGGDPSAAAEAALAAVAVEPLHESAHRAAIRAHLAEGNRAEAQRQLASMRRLLRDEVGVRL